jgi:light-regulated signal transduction histidine kinase (bacteriophytochrome)
MYSLVHGLLDYSRITSDGRAFKLNKLNDVLKKVLADVKTAATEAEADIQVEALPEILCDELQIRQLFQNLISNAIKFRSADRKPLIQVKAEQQNGKLLFMVQDNGIGLDMKYAQQIFQIFSRLHTTDKYHGSGIGLALCKKIIERHNGNIWVESKQQVGTSVYFTLAAVS